jgi:uncharacterized protein (DUF488 family)
MRTTTLYTIGYQGRSLKDLLAALAAYGVERVIDVRQLPLSRKEGFSKTPLGEALRAVGIAYESLPALGPPREMRRAFKGAGDWPAYAAAFEAYLDTQQEALGWVTEMALCERTCLMCFERNSAECHRSIVARRVAEIAGSGLQVEDVE